MINVEEFNEIMGMKKMPLLSDIQSKVYVIINDNMEISVSDIAYKTGLRKVEIRSAIVRLRKLNMVACVGRIYLPAGNGLKMCNVYSGVDL